MVLVVIVLALPGRIPLSEIHAAARAAVGEVRASVCHGPLDGPFRGTLVHHDEVPENSPLALMARFASLVGRSAALMGRCPECLSGPFSLLQSPWKTAQKAKAHKEVLEFEQNSRTSLASAGKSGAFYYPLSADFLSEPG